MRIALAISLAALVAAGSGLSGQSTPTSPRARTGAEIFADKCVFCHDTGGWGTRSLARRVPADEARLTDRETLPAPYTAMVVRRGIGSMPPFNPSELSDEEIAIVARWLEQGG